MLFSFQLSIIHFRLTAEICVVGRPVKYVNHTRGRMLTFFTKLDCVLAGCARSARIFLYFFRQHKCQPFLVLPLQNRNYKLLHTVTFRRRATLSHAMQFRLPSGAPKYIEAPRRRQTVKRYPLPLRRAHIRRCNLGSPENGVILQENGLWLPKWCSRAVHKTTEECA